MSGLLLDTCALIWVMNDDHIAPEARSRISGGGEAGELWVSPISAWEIATLVSRGRLSLTMSPEDWFEAALVSPGINLAALPPKVLMQSAFLPGVPPSDPADRIVLATARANDFTLVTRDAKILAYGGSGNARVLAC
jgi:PIN domain nuclease of toxin-antitoxin system